MKNSLLLLTALLSCLSADVVAQCADEANIYSFEYDGKTYEVIRENKSWTEAAACAVDRGGYLAEINSPEEQDAVFAQIIEHGGIDPSDTEAPDGFSSYIWLGGNDINDEGNWAWNGNNDGSATAFWLGTSDGTAVEGRYSNWGLEPDNWGAGAGQDGLGLAIIDWPLGAAGQWNDVSHHNELFFLVEFDALMGVGDVGETRELLLYPNPSSGMVYIASADEAFSATVTNSLGQAIRTLDAKALASGIDLSGAGAGVYFITLQFSNGSAVTKKVVKQ
jgi:hypothetical protein